ncbi:MAG TPA: hypothetical protein VH702_02300 [Vicinamibacterales bacterium]|jgi:hypothetical protein
MTGRKFLSVLIFAALSVALSPVLAAQSNEADFKEIQAYRLTMPAFKQVMAATRNLLTGIKNDPRFQRLEQLEAEVEELEDKSDRTAAESDRLDKLKDEIRSIEASVRVLGAAAAAESLSDIDAAAQKDPMMAAAFKSAGISARDYAKFMGAYLQATMIENLRKSGTLKELPKNVNLDNVRFVAEHQAEFEQFIDELEALEKKEP